MKTVFPKHWAKILKAYWNTFEFRKNEVDKPLREIENFPRHSLVYDCPIPRVLCFYILTPRIRSFFQICMQRFRFIWISWSRRPCQGSSTSPTANKPWSSVISNTRSANSRRTRWNGRLLSRRFDENVVFMARGSFWSTLQDVYLLFDCIAGNSQKISLIVICHIFSKSVMNLFSLDLSQFIAAERNWFQPFL